MVQPVKVGFRDANGWGRGRVECKFGRQHAQLGFRDANFMVQPVKVGLRDANGWDRGRVE